jgi:Ca2+-binding EF-hand superfamily protein
MRKLLLIIAAVTLISIAGYVAGQTPSSPSTADPTEQTDDGTRMRLATMDTSEVAFERLDTDHDGRISALEAADNPQVAAAFTLADKDKDGYLSKEEFAALGTGTSSNSKPDTPSNRKH